MPNITSTYRGVHQEVEDHEEDVEPAGVRDEEAQEDAEISAEQEIPAQQILEVVELVDTVEALILACETECMATGSTESISL